MVCVTALLQICLKGKTSEKHSTNSFLDFKYINENYNVSKFNIYIDCDNRYNLELDYGG